MKPLASWSPPILKALYEGRLQIIDAPLSEHESIARQEHKNKKIAQIQAEALYRLGSNDYGMERVWADLLAIKPKDINELDLEIALVHGIWNLVRIYDGEPEPIAPNKKTKEIEAILDLVSTLQRDIKNCEEAKLIEGDAVELILHKSNFEYRNGLGETKSEPPHESWYRHNSPSLRSEVNQINVDSIIPWGDRSPLQRLGWWAREANAIGLNQGLDSFSERLSKRIPIYEENH